MSVETENQLSVTGITNAAPPDLPAVDVLEHSEEPQSQVCGLEMALNAAVASERYLIAVWYVTEGRIHLYRELGGFPRVDLESAQRMLCNDLAGMAHEP